MKIYYVSMDYWDGDYNRGYYRSPFFTKRELAEEFLSRLKQEEKNGTPKAWWTEDQNVESVIDHYATIEEEDVYDSVPDLYDAVYYRYTTLN